MPNIARHIFYLWIILLTFAGGAILVGQGQPPSSLVENLHLSECAAPCWIGIYPGETPIREVYDLLTNSFAMQPFRPTPYTLPNQSITLLLPIDRPNQQMMPIQFGILDHLADEIRIPAGLPGTSKPEVMPKLGDVFLLFGEPNCLRPWSAGSNDWSLIYNRPEGVVEIGLGGKQYRDWWQPVMLLRLRQGDFAAQADDCPSEPEVIPWRNGVHPSQVSVIS